MIYRCRSGSVEGRVGCSSRRHAYGRLRLSTRRVRAFFLPFTDIYIFSCKRRTLVGNASLNMLETPIFNGRFRVPSRRVRAMFVLFMVQKKKTGRERLLI